MLTASGDQCIHLWDTASAQGLGQFRGHNGSVKSVSPSSDGQPIFASGARLSDDACPYSADYARKNTRNRPMCQPAGEQLQMRGAGYKLAFTRSS